MDNSCDTFAKYDISFKSSEQIELGSLKQSRHYIVCTTVDPGYI